MGRGRKSSIVHLVVLAALTFGLVGQIRQQQLPAAKEARQLRSLYLNWLDAKCAYQYAPLASRDRLHSTAQALEQESDRLKADPTLRKQVGLLIENTDWHANPGWYHNGTNVEVRVGIDKSGDVAHIDFAFNAGADADCGDNIVSRVVWFNADAPYFADLSGHNLGLE